MHAVRDHASLPGRADMWVGEWVGFPAQLITEDVETWPCSVGFLVTWVAFLGS